MPRRTTVRRYRIFITINGVKYYGNRCSRPFPHMRWEMYSTEYPDHYSKEEVIQIADLYSDQSPTIDATQIVPENVDEEV